MTRVRDKRRAPFAWVTVDALRAIRRHLPTERRTGARDALLALAEAASQRRDAHHEDGDTLAELSALSGLSDRRLRDYLRDLEAIGLIAIETRHDLAGRDLPKVYSLLDAPPRKATGGGSDAASDRGDEPTDGATDGASDPTCAPNVGNQEEEEEDPPSPPSQATGGPSPQGHLAVIGKARLNPRARGVSPRQLAAAAHRQQLTDSAEAAVADVLPPCPEAQESWADICRQMRDAVGENVFEIWLAPLELVGTRYGRLVLTAPASHRAWIAARFKRVLATFSDPLVLDDDQEAALKRRREIVA